MRNRCATGQWYYGDMPITIIAVGKKHESWIEGAIERFQKRLVKPFMVEWVLLPHASLEGETARLEESERILARLTTFDYIVLLDIDIRRAARHNSSLLKTFHTRGLQSQDQSRLKRRDGGL